MTKGIISKNKKIQILNEIFNLFQYYKFFKCMSSVGNTNNNYFLFLGMYIILNSINTIFV